eukprot:Lankesteria_metandrocarpae@DN3935_c0_g1_i1.p1
MDTTGGASADMESGVLCTRLGVAMASLPLAPAYAKMLLSLAAKLVKLKSSTTPARATRVFTTGCRLIAVLSLGGVFEYRCNTANTDSTTGYSNVTDDVGLLLKWSDEFSRLTSTQKRHVFCESHALNYRAMAEGVTLAVQLEDQLARRFPQLICSTGETDTTGSSTSSKLNEELTVSEKRMIYMSVLSGAVDRIAVLSSGLDPSIAALPPTTTKSSGATRTRPGAHRAYTVLLPSEDHNNFTPVTAHIHPNSVLHRVRPRPTIIAFNYLQKRTNIAPESSSAPSTPTSVYMLSEAFAVDPADLARLFIPPPSERYSTEETTSAGGVSTDDGRSSIVDYSRVLQSPAPMYDAKRDAAVAFVSPRLTRFKLDLPSVEVLLGDGRFAVAIFAAEFLRGNRQLCPHMALLRPYFYPTVRAALYKLSAVAVVNTTLHNASAAAAGTGSGTAQQRFLQMQIEQQQQHQPAALTAFCAALLREKIASKKALRFHWQHRDSTFLLKECLRLLRAPQARTSPYSTAADREVCKVREDLSNKWPPTLPE